MEKNIELFGSIFYLRKTDDFFSVSGIPELKNRVAHYDVIKPIQVKLWRHS